MRLQIFHPNQMFIYEFQNVNISELENLFLRHPDRTVYITKKQILIGIITAGDFVRFQCNKGDLVQKQYQVLTETETENAEVLFERYKNIISIPVTRENGEILYEFYREKTDKYDGQEKAREAVSVIGQEYDSLTRLCNLYDIHEIIITGEEICEEKIEYLPGEGVTVQILPFDVLLEQAEKKDSLVIDISNGENILFLHERYCILNGLSYLKMSHIYGILYNLENLLFHYERCFEWLEHSYNHIAVVLCGGSPIETEFLEYVAKKQFIKCQIYKKSELCFAGAGEAVTVTGLKEAPDIVISFQITEALFKVVCEEKEIPYFLFYSFYDSWNYCDYDVAYNIIPELKQKGIEVLAFSVPKESEVLTPDEQAAIRSRKNIVELSNASESDCAEFWKFTGYGIKNKKFLQECCEAMANRVQFGYADPIDYSGEYFNYLSGCRYTTGINAEGKNRIFMFGPCLVRGSYVQDSDTISSILQKEIGKRYCVLNLGSYFAGMNLKIRQYNFQAGDIVIICIKDKDIYKKNKIEVLDLTEVYQELTDKKQFIWDNMFHINRILACKIAECLYQSLKLEDKTRGTAEEAREVCFSMKKNIGDIKNFIGDREFKKWISGLEKTKRKGLIGAVVMNCNPFTRGHRYLIEKALENVEFLYIFVVEENRSFFSFKDRIELVRKGTADLKNILVYPSGSLIISSATLPGYFEKETMQEVTTVDTSRDVTLFATVIAPLLNIKARFVGEEPTDPFTYKYNRTLEQILPVYGIQLIEIPRLEIEGRIVSASKVRDCLKTNNVEDIMDIVPESTLQFLLN